MRTTFSFWRALALLLVGGLMAGAASSHGQGYRPGYGPGYGPSYGPYYRPAFRANPQIPRPGPVLVESTFSQGDEGWRFHEATSVGTLPVREPRGGDRGTPFISFTLSQSESTGQWVAPAQFLGNQVKAYRGRLDFFLKQLAPGVPGADLEVALRGGGRTILQSRSGVSMSTTTWERKTVVLDEHGWIDAHTREPVTQCQFLNVLANLTAMAFTGSTEKGTGSSAGLDTVELRAGHGEGKLVVTVPALGPLEFPSTQVNQTSQGSVTIANFGDGVLFVKQPVITMAEPQGSPPVFSVEDPADICAVVAADGNKLYAMMPGDDTRPPDRATFNVTFKPLQNDQDYKGVLELQWGQGRRGNPKRTKVELKGTTAASAVKILEPPNRVLDLGTAPVGQPQSGRIRLHNTARTSLQMTIGAVQAPFGPVRGQRTVALPAGRTAALGVTFTPRLSDPVGVPIQQQLTFTTSEQPPATLTVTLVGHSSGCPPRGPGVQGVGECAGPGFEVIDPVPPNSLDFGTTADGTTVEKSIRVRNNGERALRVNIGPLAAPFSSPHAGQQVQVPRGESALPVRFTPRKSDPVDTDLAGNLTVTTNERPARRLEVRLVGRRRDATGALEVVEPVAPAALDFGDLMVMRLATREIRVRNHAQRPLTVEVTVPLPYSSPPAAFRVTVPARQEGRIPVQFSPRFADPVGTPIAKVCELLTDEQPPRRHSVNLVGRQRPIDISGGWPGDPFVTAGEIPPLSVTGGGVAFSGTQRWPTLFGVLTFSVTYQGQGESSAGFRGPGSWFDEGSQGGFGTTVHLSYSCQPDPRNPGMLVESLNGNQVPGIGGVLIQQLRIVPR